MLLELSYLTIILRQPAAWAWACVRAASTSLLLLTTHGSFHGSFNSGNQLSTWSLRLTIPRCPSPPPASPCSFQIGPHVCSLPFGLLSVRYTELTGLNLAPLFPGRQTPYIRRLWNASYSCLLLASRLFPSIRHAVVPLPTEAECLPEASVQLLHDNPTLA